MAISRLIKDIKDKLFVEDGHSIIVVLNPDGILQTPDFIDTFYAAFSIEIVVGDSLDLRVLYELSRHERACSHHLFVMRDEFDIVGDIEPNVDFISFQMRSFFRLFPWETIREQPLEILERLYDEKPIIKLSAFETLAIIQGYKESEIKDIEVKPVDLLKEFNAATSSPDFFRPGQWMGKAAELMVEALATEQWPLIQPRINELNALFLSFLRESYPAIVSSACGKLAPRIVTQVLPFLKRQPEQKTALVVIDGMNFWQAELLIKELESKLGLSANTECIYSWLPSTTEWSRQAIFRGTYPIEDYAQNPTSEKAIWKGFWKENGCADFQIGYQHAGIIQEESSVTRMAYVEVELDEKMHSSDNYYYLYDATKRWVREEQILRNIKHLVDGGYKVFITTDHGNIAATPYKKISAQAKLGSNLSLRHITIPPEASKELFEREHKGHLQQLDSASRTYYAVADERFDSDAGVTHGCLHFLEVLVPFITIDK